MVNPLELSDEDFRKQSAPPVVQSEGTPAVVTPEAATETPATETETPAVVDTTNQEDEVEEEENTEADTQGPADQAANTVVPAGSPLENKTGTQTTAPPAAKAPEPGKDGEQADEPGSAAKPAAGSVDYEGFYKDLMAPFKANGKTIELKTPAEVKQLMQMGANYTAKMQAIAPHRKILLMLENNQLLDEGKLSFAIDLVNKNPEAIKKLLVDSQIDPMEIDTSVAPNYREGNHRVTDVEAAFRSTLDEVQSTDSGKALVQDVVARWDHASKEILWSEPGILRDLQIQRDRGVYDRVVNEIDRQRMLGTIAPEMTFLQAYQLAGEQLTKANAFADLIDKPAQVVPTAPVATRVATPKPILVNSEKANAAAAVRSTPKTAKVFVNPLAMSDDDFLKHMQNRV